MPTTHHQPAALPHRYASVRAQTEELASPLSPEDQMVQSMPDVSPTKWHRGHTSWFFETFLLQPSLDGYEAFHPTFAYIFNSYYETVGARHPRAERGLISRPGTHEVADYRRHVDEAMARLLAQETGPEVAELAQLGCHHEEQHQELLLMDIKHVLSRNPLRPAYRTDLQQAPSRATKTKWIEHPGGLVEIGHGGPEFAFDNESPRHQVLLTPFALADRPVTCGDWLAFMEDDGYSRPEFWLSDGWAMVQQLGWEAPLYWTHDGEVTGGGSGGHPSGWEIFTLGGQHPVDPAEPVCHVSYYEADAFAHWSGDRLPTESEWETVAASDNYDTTKEVSFRPGLGGADRPMNYGQVWEWTASAYSPYPGFRAPSGAVGEYNGKFMVNQYVLRGGSCVTPSGHARPTYRNFFPASARWAFSGLRLARDI